MEIENRFLGILKSENGFTIQYRHSICNNGLNKVFGLGTALCSGTVIGSSP
jgi:hypothetical protein